MKKKLLLLAGGLMTVALSVALFTNKPLTAQEAPILKNVEALTRHESPGGYPEGYDVKDHMFDFGDAVTGSFGVDGDGSISIEGMPVQLGLGSGATVTITYHVGNCRTPASGTCCPYARIGEIKILGWSF